MVRWSHQRPCSDLEARREANPVQFKAADILALRKQCSWLLWTSCLSCLQEDERQLSRHPGFHQLHWSFLTLGRRNTKTGSQGERLLSIFISFLTQLNTKSNKTELGRAALKGGCSHWRRMRNHRHPYLRTSVCQNPAEGDVQQGRTRLVAPQLSLGKSCRRIISKAYLRIQGP